MSSRSLRNVYGKIKAFGKDITVAIDKVPTILVSILHLRTKSISHRLLRMSSNDFIQIHPTVLTMIKNSYLKYQPHRTKAVVNVNRQFYIKRIGMK